MKTTNSKSQPKKAAKKKSTKEDDSEVADGLRELFVAELKDIYWAENALLKAIPKMIKNASSDELITALEDHLSVTEEQVNRLDQVFEIIEVKAQGKKCEAMAGLIKEAEEIMKETKKGDVRDAGIISAAQKVEHYEIATYGTLRTFALTLEEHDAADLLEETLQEEKDADQSLTEIAEASINAEAV
jgi:ferritin-like metal-binding protein YciE